MSRSLQQIVLDRLLARQRKAEMRRAQQETAAGQPELLAAYAAFARGQQSGSVRQPFKGWDLWKILLAEKPRKIVELGSGTTSAVFALYARRNDAAYVAFEHHPEWCQVTLDCLRAANVIGAEDAPVKCVPMREDSARPSTGFVEDVPDDADFFYVDGPPCPIRDGRKLPNDDVVRLLDRGGRPQCIVVDGRIDTVDLIRAHPAGAEYELAPSYVYCVRRGRWRDALSFAEHSVFRRKPAV
ncbi:hypothetical protein [Pelagibius sp. 7325]|uniref:hypothetical protein n=1 Tax=Pelagibius sp. 7325 TaxID=3131994 RepID=UPI0030EDD4FE